MILRIFYSAILSGVILMTGCAQNRGIKIVFIGDSLTTCGGQGGRYTDWLAQWRKKTIIINKGISGDTLAGGRARFEKDVVAERPDIVVIELGANDFWRQSRPIDNLTADLEAMVVRSKDIGAQVVIASCFGGRQYAKEPKVEFEAKKFAYALAIAAMETRIAEKYGCFYVPNMQLDIKPNGKAPYWDDTNHPNKAGNELVARRILVELDKAIKNAKGLKQTL